MISGAEVVGITLVVAGLGVLLWVHGYLEMEDEKKQRELIDQLSKDFKKNIEDMIKKGVNDDKVLKFDIES